MQPDIDELKLTVKISEQNEVSKYNEYIAAKRATVQAMRNLLSARAESVGIRVGSPVTIVTNKGRINGVVMALDVRHNEGFLIIAPLTDSGETHNATRYESYWQEDGQSFSNGLQRREIGFTTLCR